MKRETIIGELNDRTGACYTLKRFKPSVFRLLPKNSLYEVTPLTLLQLFFRRRYGYTIYTAYRKEEPAAYCLLKNTQGERYAFMHKPDVLISPYYVKESSRGSGLSSALVVAALLDRESEGGEVYALVRYNNEASLHILDRLGFTRLGWLSGKDIISEPTNVIVFRR